MRPSGMRDDAKALNVWLDNLFASIITIRNHRRLKNISVSPKDIIDELLGRPPDKVGFTDLISSHIINLQKLVKAGDITNSTPKKYLYILTHLRAFMASRFHLADIPSYKIDHDFIISFYEYLRHDKRIGEVTAKKYLSNIRTIILKALQSGYVHEDPFKGFKLAYKEKQRIPLSIKELLAIMSKIFFTKRLSQIRDFFVFSCFTGLCYGDLKALITKNIVYGCDGRLWIEATRQKTGNLIRLPILFPALNIIKRYSRWSKTDSLSRIFPIPSNQKVNEYLKEIGNLCGITKLLTFHLARHTFATTIAVSNGVPIETVRLMLSHSSLRYTLRYVNIDDVKISSDITILEGKLVHLLK